MFRFSSHNQLFLKAKYMSIIQIASDFVLHLLLVLWSSVTKAFLSLRDYLLIVAMNQRHEERHLNRIRKRKNELTLLSGEIIDGDRSSDDEKQQIDDAGIAIN